MCLSFLANQVAIGFLESTASRLKGDGDFTVKASKNNQDVKLHIRRNTELTARIKAIALKNHAT